MNLTVRNKFFYKIGAMKANCYVPFPRLFAKPIIDLTKLARLPVV
jgi:hypothetical protein